MLYSRLQTRSKSLRKDFTKLSKLELSLEASFKTEPSDLKSECRVLKDASNENLKYESSLKAFPRDLHLNVRVKPQE